jgi:rubrerythrin
MANLKGSQTEKNILTAFCGESQARNKYTYFASQAKKEGYVQIQHIFEETANQEKEHAKRLFKLLEGGEVEITATFPAGVIGTTVENLKEAAGGENYEHTTMYPGFIEQAKKEGNRDAVRSFSYANSVEVIHENKYIGAAEAVGKGKDLPAKKLFICPICGNIEEEHPPERCSVCGAPGSSFKEIA